jgi:hypothetical protein
MVRYNAFRTTLTQTRKTRKWSHRLCTLETTQCVRCTDVCGQTVRHTKRRSIGTHVGPCTRHNHSKRASLFGIKSTATWGHSLPSDPFHYHQPAFIHPATWSATVQPLYHHHLTIRLRNVCRNIYTLVRLPNRPPPTDQGCDMP